MTRYKFEWLPGALWESEELLEELSTLFSQSYGTWSQQSSTSPGKPVRLSAKRIRLWLSHPNASIATARHGGELVGYAIAVQSKVEEFGIVSWVTQLVVREDHRRNGVGKELLFSIWGFTDNAAWGLITANPYTVRALEKATRRRCNPILIAKHKRRILRLGQKIVPYVKPGTEARIDFGISRINTEFHLEHSRLDDMLARVTTTDAPWQLGHLPEGWEWLAFTFREQPPFGLEREEIDQMMRTSDTITKQAYSRMTLDTSHRWAQHANAEAQFAVKNLQIPPRGSVLDLGCGTGRHSIALGLLGFEVLGVDYLREYVDFARRRAGELMAGRTQFIEGDCRNLKLERQYDATLCLYDVIGTYADDAENLRILKAIAGSLKPGGRALISVMNYTLTESKAKFIFSLREEPDRLLSLPPSRTMEGTGDIFNPDYYIIDRDTRVIYRKEQFAQGHSLPAELIVRDRRYTQREIEGYCLEVGLLIEWSRFVRAGQWEIPLDAKNDRAKEILVLCQKPK